MIEMGTIIAGFTLETQSGPQSGESMMRAINHGSRAFRIEALTDSYSIFSYLAAQHLKLPAEKGTFYHLAYLREKLVTGVISSYSWTDTRDMAADGLTKGSADRTALASIMDGHYKLHYEVHEFREPTKSATTTTAASSSLLCTSGGGGTYGASPARVLEGGSNSTASWLAVSVR